MAAGGFAYGLALWASNASPAWLRIVLVTLLSAFALIRFAELATVAIRVTLLWRTEPRQTVASFARSAVFGVLNYVEIALLFAILYSMWAPWGHWLDPLHRSAQIQFAVGLPDTLRPVAWVHAMTSLLFLLALVSPILTLWATGRREEMNHP